MREDEKPNRKSRRYKSNFRFWKKPLWLRILVVFLFISSAVIISVSLIYLFRFPKGWHHCLFIGTNLNAHNKYLLSATAQVLGTIFALVFSIALVAGQTVARYTHRAINIIFDWLILLYAGTFALVTVWVLWCIQYPSNSLTRIALGTGALFILSIPAFIFHLVQRMNLQWIPKRLKEICVEALKYSAEEKAREMIDALDNIVTVALKEGNLEALEAAEKSLVDLLLEVGRYHNDPQRKQPELHRKVFETLYVACLEAIDNPRAPQVIIEKLGKVGAQTIEEWLKSSDIPKDATYEEIKNEIPQTALYAINIIMIVEKECKKGIQDRLLFACAVALGEMLKASSLKSLWVFVLSKVKHVCKRFEEKQWVGSWSDKVRKLKLGLGITS